MGEFTVCLVHPGALPVTVYRPLAGALSPRVRLAILEMRLLQEYREAMTGGRSDVTVERLAGGLAAQLPRQGSYVLAGWSFGGLVALALARRPVRARVAATPSPDLVLHAARRADGPGLARRSGAAERRAR